MHQSWPAVPEQCIGGVAALIQGSYTFLQKITDLLPRPKSQPEVYSVKAGSCASQSREAVKSRKVEET